MGTKVLTGCVYCGTEDRPLRPCCLKHVRLVCDACEQTRPFQADHPVAA